MMFFTRAWATGERTDEDFEAAPEAYRAHLAALDLPPPLVALADADLHDGQVLDVNLSGGRLSVRLRVGDLQHGYADLRLDYLDASLGSGSFAALEAARDSEVEVLYAEVDRAGSRFEHRMLLWPKGGVAVTFADVRVASTPVASRAAV